MGYKVGDTVKWCWSETHPSTFIIMDVDSSSVVLKQNFGLGQVLKGRIPISELNLPHTMAANRNVLLDKLGIKS